MSPSRCLLRHHKKTNWMSIAPKTVHGMEQILIFTSTWLQVSYKSRVADWPGVPLAQHDYETEHSDDNTDVSREIITSRSWLATIRGNKKIGGYQFRFAFKLFNIAQISHNRRWCTFFSSSKKSRPWQDSNLQSPDPKSGALSIRPHGLIIRRYKPMRPSIPS